MKTPHEAYGGFPRQRPSVGRQAGWPPLTPDAWQDGEGVVGEGGGQGSEQSGGVSTTPRFWRPAPPRGASAFFPSLTRPMLRQLLAETSMSRTELYKLFNRFKVSSAIRPQRNQTTAPSLLVPHTSCLLHASHQTHTPPTSDPHASHLLLIPAYFLTGPLPAERHRWQDRQGALQGRGLITVPRRRHVCRPRLHSVGRGQLG